MVGREISATEIGKHSELIKSAQEDMATMDVLVCGQCLTVCHFIEDFEKHKQTPCSKENNNIRECKDTKPKIWAFLLWKATQLHNNKNNNNGTTTTNSWSLYQTWIKMDESVRDTWVMAGRTIQSFSKVGQGGLQEMPVKITKTVVNNNAAGIGAGAIAGASVANETGSVRKPHTLTKPQVTTNVKTPVGKLPVAGKSTDIDGKSEAKVGSGGVSSVGNTPTNLLAKIGNKKSMPITAAGTTPTTTNIQGKVNTLNLQASKPVPLSRRATRSSPNSDDVVQENVEKIVAKRFNPRRKMHEYLVKWDGRPHDQNTWEPLSHLEHVQHLLDIFEKQLARQKENRAALQAKQSTTSGGGSTTTTTSPIGASITAAATLAAGGNVAAASKASKSETTLITSTPITKANLAAAGLANKAKGSPFFKSAAASAASVTVGNVAAAGAAAVASSISGTITLTNEMKVVDSVSSISPSTRPTRTSKTKAMDQVKQWVTDELPTTGSAADSGDNADDNGLNSMNSSSGSTGSVGGGGGGGGLKRKHNDSIEDLVDEFNTSDTPSATAATMEDLEEDLIPSHTVKRMKNGTGVSVESKMIRMNGTNTRGNTTSFSGESLPVGPKSAEVILTKEKGVSGIVRRPGFAGGIKPNSLKPEAQVRILSKEESAVMTTGIVRTTSKTSSLNAQLNSSSESSPNVTPTATTRSTQLQRLVGGRQTPTMPLNSSALRSQQVVQQRTASGTIIQRRQVAVGGQQRPTIGGGGPRSNLQFQSSASAGGRMVLPRGAASAQIAGHQTRTVIASGGGGGKVVTPEQKILQLSRSGDLKVTKKMMTREDAVAQRLGTQRQQQMQQRQSQHQSQVQIQKVQQIAPPHAASRSVSAVSVRKRADGTYTAHEEAAKSIINSSSSSQTQLCPITGKVLGGGHGHTEENQQISSQQLQAQMLTAAAAAAEQQQQQEQLELQQQEEEASEQTLLLTSDQLLTNEDGTPLLVTGEDGTVYQVAGKNTEGQTILVTQGPDGEQQFAYVATAEGDENQVLTLDNAVAEAVAHLPGGSSGEQQTEVASGGGQYLVKATQEDGTTHMVAMTEAELQQHQVQMMQQQHIAISEAGGDTTSTTTSTTNAVAVAGSTSSAGAGLNQICIQTGDGADGQEANIPAEVVQAELPSPGGTRRVVLLLQDGTFMMTEMQDEEFKALNIAA